MFHTGLYLGKLDKTVFIHLFYSFSSINFDSRINWIIGTEHQNIDTILKGWGTMSIFGDSVLLLVSERAGSISIHR